MKLKKCASIKPTTAKTGQGLLNSLLNKIPVKLHIPGYNYCGPASCSRSKRCYENTTKNGYGSEEKEEI